MQISFHPPDESTALEYLHWRYQKPYDFYNGPPSDLKAALRYNLNPNNQIYALRGPGAELVGYCSYCADARVPGGDYTLEALDIGLMLKPDLTGQGLGPLVAEQVVRHGIDRHAPTMLRVTIAAFNRRAISAWASLGFRETQTFERYSNQVPYVVMTRAAQSPGAHGPSPGPNPGG